MPLLVFETTHSVAGMGTVTAVAAVGQLLAATCSGIVVDRVHRRHLMLGCDFVRLALYAVLPVLAGLGALSLGVIYVVALLTSAASNLFMVAYLAAARGDRGCQRAAAGDASADVRRRFRARGRGVR